MSAPAARSGFLRTARSAAYAACVAMAAPLSCTALFAVVMGGTGCGPDAVANDRTGGYELEYRWTNAAEDKRLYFAVDRRGSFGSGGGLKAAQRETTYAVSLSDAEIAEFVALLRATDFASRPEDVGTTGDLHIVVVRALGEKHAFELRGSDATLDALRAWCQSISIRQFRDVIESQPEAGPRER